MAGTVVGALVGVLVALVFLLAVECDCDPMIARTRMTAIPISPPFCQRARLFHLFFIS